MDRNTLRAMLVIPPVALVVGALARAWPLWVTLLACLALGTLAVLIAGRLDRRS